MTGWSQTPAARVSEYVRRILVIEHASVTAPFTLPLYANGTPTLLFQTAKGDIGGRSNHLTLFGQTVLPEALTLSDNFTLIAYFFEPYALYSLFGLSPQDLTDHPVELQLITAAKAKELQEQLLNAPTTAAMIELIDDFVVSLTARIQTDIALIRFATSAIARDPQRNMEEMAVQDLHLTKRTFMRLFEKQVGILPGQYRRIVQFDAAFRQLQSRRFDKLSDIAFAQGYADQSHFIRAFKEFTAITPKDYEKLMGPRR